MPYDWLYFNLVKNVSKEKTFHACQIPQALSELLINSCTQPNDIVLVLFGGSGSELEICKKINRQYISAEIDEKYYNMILDRLSNGHIQDKYKLITSYSNENKVSPQLILLNERKNNYK
jgi:DNA modification methylase